jgi:hypothetical protein
VATGEASFVGSKQRGLGLEAAPGEAVPATAEAGRSDARQWAIALAALVLMAVAMAAATIGISSL